MGKFCDSLGSNITVQYTVGPIIILHGEITGREYVDRLGNYVHPMVQMLFLIKIAVHQDDNALIHTAELFSHDLKSMKVNINIFHGQHNHQILTLNHSGKFWRL
jgi:hypothetical protein